MTRRRFLAVALFVAGCHRGPKPATGSGAREAAFGFFDALRRQDWPAAYTVVAPPRPPADRFEELARRYVRAIGFEPGQVYVTTCQERGAEATAHIVYTGPSALKQRHKDGITLRREADGWGVVLPANFGR